MPDYRSRQELRSEVIRAFSMREEVFQIQIFGKEALQKDDQYSDIDLIVRSNDLEKTWKAYRQIFSSISPIIGTYPLGGGSDWYAEALILENYSPYHKIDFSIGHGLDPSLTTMVTVYDCPEKGKTPLTSLSPVKVCFDTSYHMADRLFAIPRFLKCLFRQDIDMYRRWSATLNGVLVLLYEKKFGWQVESQRTKLMPYEMEKLMGNLSAEERQQLYAVGPPDGNVEIGLSFLNGMNYYITLAREKAADLHIALNEPLIEYVQTFMEAEIRRAKAG